MAIQQVKAYVDVQSLAQLAQFRGVSGEVVVRAYQLNWRLRENIGNLLAALAGQRGPYLITGPRGAGKSHLLTLIRALTTSPGLSNALRDPAIVSAAGKLADERFFIIELSITGDEPPDLLSMIRDELANRESNPIIFTDEEWSTSISGSRVFRLIKSKLSVGVVLSLFIDGLSTPMRANKRTQTQLANWLSWVADQFRDQSQGLIVTLDEDILSDVGDILLNKFKLERLDTVNLRDVADRFILKKNDYQRQDLGSLYNEVVRLMPQFSWSKDDFVALYPIHPAILEVAPAMRTFSPSFSLLGFVSSAASKAASRRGMNLSALDELFDSFEFDLRKNEQLAGLFSAYDLIVQQGIPRLVNFDEKMWAKLALKALFIFSLANKGVSLNKLADSVMLYDDRDFGATNRRLNTILECFSNTVPDALEIVGEGRSRTYRFVIKSSKSSKEVLEEAIEKIEDSDFRLTEILVTTGGEFFSDWPLNLDNSIRAELAVSWRNTSRAGVLKLGTKVEMSPINNSSSSSGSEALGVDIVQDIVDEEDLLPIDALLDPYGQTGEFSLSQIGCEWDWQICLIPINCSPPIDIPFFNPPTLIYWIPSEPTKEDMTALKQALVLRTQAEELAQQKIDCIAEQQKIDLQLQEIFQRIYVDGGQFINPGSDRPILIYQPAIAGSTIVEMLSLLLAESLLLRYPEHPNFSIELNEQELGELVRNLFGKADPFSSVTQAYAETYCVPLSLVSKAGDYYELDLKEENQSLAIKEVLKMVSETPKNSSLQISQVYSRLRAEPFGLKSLPQKLLILALVADWTIELTSEEGRQVLNATNLGLEQDFNQYTKIQRLSSFSHSPKILCEWYRLLTSTSEEIDLISPAGREQIKAGLQAWQENWTNLAVADQLEKLPVEILTTRLWQMGSSCKRYFETVSDIITSILKQSVTLETGIGQIIDSFGEKDTVYFGAVSELTILVNFLAWLPFFLETKDYILFTEPTNDSQIEMERAELIAFLEQSQRLFDEEKRQRYETVYRSFQAHYTDFYATLHDNLMSPNQLSGLEELLNSDKWTTFELISQLSVANQHYYLLAQELISKVRTNVCHLPVRELLQTQPFCNCSFRISRNVNSRIFLVVLKDIIEQGIKYHQQLLSQYKTRLKTLTSLETQEINRIETLLTSFFNGESRKLTLYSVKKLNEVLDGSLKAPVGLVPAVKLSDKITKQDLRERFERWLENLPEEPGVALEFSNRRDFVDE